MTCNKKCKRNVRFQLATFAMINYLLGMGTFMFFLCSQSPKHLDHLGILFSNPFALVTGDTEIPQGIHDHH